MAESTLTIVAATGATDALSAVNSSRAAAIAGGMRLPMARATSTTIATNGVRALMTFGTTVSKPLKARSTTGAILSSAVARNGSVLRPIEIRPFWTRTLMRCHACVSVPAISLNAVSVAPVALPMSPRIDWSTSALTPVRPSTAADASAPPSSLFSAPMSPSAASATSPSAPARPIESTAACAEANPASVKTFTMSAAGRNSPVSDAFRPVTASAVEKPPRVRAATAATVWSRPMPAAAAIGATLPSDAPSSPIVVTPRFTPTNRKSAAWAALRLSAAQAFVASASTPTDVSRSIAPPMAALAAVSMNVSTLSAGTPALIA